MVKKSEPKKTILDTAIELFDYANSLTTKAARKKHFQKFLDYKREKHIGWEYIGLSEEDANMVLDAVEG